ncbi:MAG: hypothetical protein E1N59_2227 [Puniceicoccaceae bacterium 5H]|nr:MAG: hypothetical protein E1N59_2227 [Puniceicoccaceae bacterium 5H]
MYARGWSLLELVFVVAILGLMMGALGWGGLALQNRQRYDQAGAEMAALAEALQTYHRYWGDYPHAPLNADGAAKLYRALQRGEGPRGEPAPADWQPLAAGVDEGRLLDPWGTPYGYVYGAAEEVDWRAPQYRLVCRGKSALRSGADEDLGVLADGTLREHYDERAPYADNLVYGE